MFSEEVRNMTSWDVLALALSIPLLMAVSFLYDTLVFFRRRRRGRVAAGAFVTSERTNPLGENLLDGSPPLRRQSEG
jgi:hypothetical protein